MWEEPLDSLRVTHRLSVQEYAGEIEVHSDESDEWLKVDANGMCLNYEGAVNS